jgi:sulfonate transport system substrate-binding protein
VSFPPFASLSRRSAPAGGAGLLALAAIPGLSRAAAPVDFAGVIVRAAKDKGREDNLPRAAGPLDTPYAVTSGEFASGNVIVEAMNAGLVDVGPLFDRRFDSLLAKSA